MNFFKFIDSNNKSLSNQRIHYEEGKVIVEQSTDLNPRLQCASGIHAIHIGKNPIDHNRIYFGPKVAFLEADEKDVIYFSDSGKCRLKQCIVTKIIDTKDLPKNTRTNF